MIEPDNQSVSVKPLSPRPYESSFYQRMIHRMSPWVWSLPVSLRAEFLQPSLKLVQACFQCKLMRLCLMADPIEMTVWSREIEFV